MSGRERQEIREPDVGRVSAAGKGVVLPAGSVPAAAPPPAGPLEVRIDGSDESGHLRVTYPGGFVKHHQAASVEELAAKVVNVLRSRHGLSDVQFLSAPPDLAPGQSFQVKG